MTPADDRDQVRLLVGDTDSSDPLLYDDEIDALIAARTIETDDGDVANLPAAAADAAAAIAARFARDFSFAEDGQRFDRAQKHAHYLALERSLRSRAGGAFVSALDETT